MTIYDLGWVMPAYAQQHYILSQQCASGAVVGEGGGRVFQR